jgi:hydroxyacylglutathione hydrolase
MGLDAPAASDVTVIPCLRDNYAYLVACTATGAAAVVDPSEAAPVLAALAGTGLRLTTILNTHHHWDHTGGNAALIEHFGELAVVAHASDQGRVPGQNVAVEDGDTVLVGALAATVRHVPGHTLGAVAYVFGGGADAAVFTGDTLFAGGCGRLFEGTPEMMYHSLTACLVDALAPEARLYCGHEYTVSNLRFAATAEPRDRTIATRLAWAVAQREAGRATVPTTVAAERDVNVFVRAPNAEAFAALRRAKDAFRG